ncbi:hypothetical protein [Labrys monachus]|uniref:Uncharacterized protein n=1 Tax=Labrys monachus TaxID=217067 RepID=A0ABU0F969_9HYPH|nr:hypothetical protein [Labrys monachus]MDQ0390633.1 hypothetical protein [Labrys monachus]
MSSLLQNRAVAWGTTRDKPVSKRIARLNLELSEKKRARKRAGSTWTGIAAEGV